MESVQAAYVAELNKLVMDDLRKFVREEMEPSAVKAQIAERFRAFPPRVQVQGPSRV